MNSAASEPTGFPIHNSALPAGAAPRSVEYTLTADELAESFVRQTANRPAIPNPARQNSLWTLWLLVLMVGPSWIAALIRSPHGVEVPGALLPVYLGLGVWLAICLIAVMPRRRRKTAPEGAHRPYYQRVARDAFYAPLLGRYRLEISPEGVFQASNHREVRLRWAGVKAIVASPAVTYFDLGPAGHFVVPSRAFSDDATYWAFVRQAREYKAAVDQTNAP